ncbi:MAG: hypothetical protein LBO79_07595 [Zoogloeaceae bacterium]|nr:hypothetical protein [Zoogloeaceae bacterium]
MKPEDFFPSDTAFAVIKMPTSRNSPASISMGGDGKNGSLTHSYSTNGK